MSSPPSGGLELSPHCTVRSGGVVGPAATFWRTEIESANCWLLDDGKFHVTEFEVEHNHELVGKNQETQIESSVGFGAAVKTVSEVGARVVNSLRGVSTKGRLSDYELAAQLYYKSCYQPSSADRQHFCSSALSAVGLPQILFCSSNCWSDFAVRRLLLLLSLSPPSLLVVTSSPLVAVDSQSARQSGAPNRWLLTSSPSSARCHATRSPGSSLPARYDLAAILSYLALCRRSLAAFRF
ncbi:hypothetical protein KSP40_PGU001372 [Platanthera guangdongensis]|uniref:Protein FAR1-RELATED SEQUENCE n=1 Tax=Platanthera guangdongensis TaxID=2320717 RepID=A0ABR2LYK7_9ASPA